MARSAPTGCCVPTVLSGVTPDMKVCRKEVFGPVVTIQAYDDLDEAIALSNDTEYGLQAAIFTSDLGKAMKAARTSTSGASSSTRCRPGVPTKCPTAVSATAATRVKARRTACTR